MKRLELKPEGFPCTLDECPPGFFLREDSLCFKSEYHTDQKADAYCDTGEYFWGGTNDVSARGKLIVQPVVYEWIEDEE